MFVDSKEIGATLDQEGGVDKVGGLQRRHQRGLPHFVLEVQVAVRRLHHDLEDIPR